MENTNYTLKEGVAWINRNAARLGADAVALATYVVGTSDGPPVPVPAELMKAQLGFSHHRLARAKRRLTADGTFRIITGRRQIGQADAVEIGQFGVKE